MRRRGLLDGPRWAMRGSCPTGRIAGTHVGSRSRTIRRVTARVRRIRWLQRQSIGKNSLDVEHVRMIENEHLSTLGWWPRFGGFTGARVLIFDGYQPILLLDKTDDLVDFDYLLPLRDFLQFKFERQKAGDCKVARARR